MLQALIVGDDPSTVSLLSTLLQDRGFSTRTAATLSEARESLDPRPDVCFVDAKLPDGDGIDLLHDGLARQSEVVLVAGQDCAEPPAEGVRLGLRECVTKPLSNDVLDRLLVRFQRRHSGTTKQLRRRKVPMTLRTMESPEISMHVGESLADVEQRLILHTVRSCRTQDEAARMLGVSAKTLYNKLRLYQSWHGRSNHGSPARDELTG